MGDVTDIKDSPLYKACLQFMEEDLKASALDPKQTPVIPFPAHPKLKEGLILAAYMIPYFDRMGNQTEMYRAKVLRHEKTPSTIGKYIQPSKKQIGDAAVTPYFPVNRMELTLDRSQYWICEGEKKIQAVMQNWSRFGCAIGGCWNWKSPNGRDVHPELIRDIQACDPKEIIIVPDGDWYRVDIGAAYGMLANELHDIFKIPVKIVDLRGGKAKKIDDYILEGYELENLKVIDCTGDVIHPADYLQRMYGVQCTGTKDKATDVRPLESNINILFNQHPYFMRFSYDNSRRCFMDGDKPIGNMDIHMYNLTSHFQRNLSMTGIAQPRLSAAFRNNFMAHGVNKKAQELDSLEWDGIDRLEALVRAMKVPDDDVKYAADLMGRFIYMHHARVRYPGCPADWMLVTVGPQGTGKSKFIETLFGLRDGDVVQLIGQLEKDADLFQAIHKGFIISFDELATIVGTKRGVEHMKSFLSESKDTWRDPYAASTVTHLRRSVIYGSTNTLGFLRRDPTGYRRWGVLEITELMNWQWILEHRELILSQVWHQRDHWKGIYHKLPDEAAERAHKYEADDGSDDLTFKVQEGIESGNIPHHRLAGGVDIVLIADVIELLKVRDLMPIRMVIGDALKDMGYVKGNRRVNGSQHKVWVRPEALGPYIPGRKF